MQKENKRILVVDGTPVSRIGTVALIKLIAPGVHVHSAQGTSEAIQRLDRYAGEIVLVIVKVSDGTAGLLNTLAAAQQRFIAWADNDLAAQAGQFDPDLASSFVLGAQLNEFYLRRLLAAEAFAGKRMPVGGTVISTLSPKQVEVFRLLGRGLNTKEIASMLEITEKTVAKHRASIADRLNLSTGEIGIAAGIYELTVSE